MAVHRGRGGARRRALVVVVLTACTFSLATSALAEVRDGVRAAWISETIRARATLASWIPPVPARPEHAAPPTPPSPVRRAPPTRPTVPPPPLTPDEILDDVRAAFCPEAARRLCDARRRCGCVYDEPDCVERVEAECSEGVFAQGVGSGAVELDVDVLARCLEGFEDLGAHCEVSATIVHGCSWPMREPSEPGEPCVHTAPRCRGGFCDATGTCVAMPGEHERSSEGWCGLDAISVSGVCRPAARAGETCEDWAQCEEGRYECMEGRCVPRVGAGGRCEASWECDTALACRGAPGAQRCAPAPIWCDDGEDCGAESECAAPPADCRPCADPSACEGDIRCVDGGRCGPGLECISSETASWRCQPTLCRVDRLIQVFRSELR